jgi:hypothetical protein
MSMSSLRLSERSLPLHARTRSSGVGPYRNRFTDCIEIEIEGRGDGSKLLDLTGQAQLRCCLGPGCGPMTSMKRSISLESLLQTTYNILYYGQRLVRLTTSSIFSFAFIKNICSLYTMSIWNVYTFVLVVCLSFSAGQVVPTTPGPNEIYKAGSNCTIAWNPDTSGSWKNLTIG